MSQPPLFSDKLYQEVFNLSNEGIIITNKSKTILYVNPAFCAITGYKPDEVIGATPSILHSGKHHRLFYEEMWYDIQTSGFWNGQIYNCRKNGVIYPEFLRIHAIKSPQGEIEHYIGVFSDLSDQEHTQRVAFYDVVTGLPNQRYLSETMVTKIPHDKRNRQSFALFVINMDDFSYIQKTVGERNGEKLLRYVGQRIIHVIRKHDLLVRYEGDVFVLIVNQATRTTDLHIVAEKIKHALCQPFQIEDHTLYTSATIGISQFPHHGESLESLSEKALEALKKGKQEGKNCYIFA